ncbi:MAG: hypothetical protein HYU64_08655 [Armatimonadetes bacterium]|nr:hypothetical protein [Armatimonadota bacterium]
MSIPIVLIYTNFGGFYLLLFLLPVFFGIYSFRETFATRVENKELSTLYALTQQISTSLELTRILEQMADQINEVLESRGTCVHLLEGSRILLSPKVTRGDVPNSLAREFKKGELPIGRLLEDKAPLCNPPGALDGFTILAVPLATDQEATGIITTIRDASQPYMKDHLEFLTIVASQASAYIQNARLFEETTRAHRELKETQGQLVQSSKMAAVGQLAAGIAHEIKNPLGAILNSAQLLEFSVSDADDVEAVKFIQEGVGRCRDIIDNLLRYSRQDFAPGEKLSLGAILADTVRLVEHSFTTDGIRIGMEVADLPPVLGNQSEMYQIFTNLLTNARDAISMKGRPGAIQVRGSLEGNLVLLEFSDDGAGIRPEDIPKVFDPFFTTKDIGKGVGLGLSIVAGIVKRMGGTISVRSAPGEGATFSLKIPVAPSRGV